MAVNVLCLECFTYALAMQTIVTLNAPLSDEATAELMALWEILEDIQANIEDIPLDQLYPMLLAIQQQIMGTEPRTFSVAGRIPVVGPL